MREAEMHRIAELVDQVLDEPENDSVLDRVRGEVEELVAGFPLYAPAMAGAGK